MPKKIVASAFGLLLSTIAANAGPITTPPPTLSAVGDVTAVYVFANALDVSDLNEVTPKAINQVFCNHTSGSCTGNNAGDTLDLGIQNGAMVFSLNDLTNGNHFTNTAADVDGNYHVLISTDFSVYNVGALPSAAASVIASLLSSGQTVTYVGWEDRTLAQGSDFDYNDLIFAFANTTTTTREVPEPLTLSLFGAGLFGTALLRRRRKTA
ncbi:MAG TPA: PEP-CTERM sorting domain-containing protein [Rhizomicrobium sp.]|nr:PEP-CTERM sorting domain-containing protein [Rhizomicrobium sp.]